MVFFLQLSIDQDPYFFLNSISIIIWLRVELQEFHLKVDCLRAQKLRKAPRQMKRR